MAEILEFSSMIRKKQDGYDSSARDAAIAEGNKKKLRDLKTRLDERPRMSKVSEREIVATNLWDLLERIESKGIKKSRVVQSWRGGTTTDSTKRLYTYTLPKDLPQGERTRRARQLTQRVAGYRALAEQAAKLMDKDRDSFLAEVFGGTEYESQNNSLPDELSAPWVVYIRDLLLKMCDWAAKRNDLNGYFSQFFSEQGLSISDDWTLGFHGNRVSELKFNELIHREHIGGCLPSVLLFRNELDSFDAEMLIASLGSAGEVLRPGESVDSAERCVVESYSELYLSIAPLGKDRASVGVFERRVITDIKVDQKAYASFEDYYDNYDGEKSDSLDAWRLVWCPEEDEDGLECEQYPVWIRPVETKQTMFGKTRTVPRESTISYDPLISVTGCRAFQEIDLLNVYNILGSDFDWDIPKWAHKHDLSDEVATAAPYATIANVVEKNLYDEDVENRLDYCLYDRAETLTDLVHAFVQKRKEDFEKHKAEILKRYEI